MAEVVARENSNSSILRWMSHWPVPSAATAAPFFLFEPELARWLSIAAGVARLTAGKRAIG